VIIRAAAAALLALAAVSARGAAPAAVEIGRAAGPIAIDGDLSDAGWNGAREIASFLETAPGDNVPPPVRTIARVARDERYLYVAIRCFDPDPKAIRAPYLDRDAIDDTVDHVTVLLDTRGDRRSAMEFRVDARGQQTDGVYEDASASEDLSPDFFFDSAASIGPDG